MRSFRYVDVPCVLVPGVLAAWGAYATSRSGQEDVRDTFPLMFLVAFVLYACAYGIARVAAQPGMRLPGLVVLVPLAALALLVGGVSLAAGYAVFAFVCAPLVGAILGLVLAPTRR